MANNYSLKKISRKDVWESENIFFLKSDYTRFSKIIYQYEIYKKIIDLPGDIFELGVFKGSSFLRFLNLRKILETDHSRKIIGFDDFGSFTPQKNKLDKKFIKEWTKETGGYGISKNELEEIIKEKKIDNIELVKGDVEKTLPKFLKKNSHVKISILHIDLDVYKPSKKALNLLYSKIVKGGVILIDDYGVLPGITKAIDEFNKKYNFKLQKLKYYKTPSFIIK